MVLGVGLFNGDFKFTRDRPLLPW